MMKTTVCVVATLANKDLSRKIRVNGVICFKMASYDGHFDLSAGKAQA